MTTYPNAFNSQLTQANNNNSYKIKPLVRLIKHWNVNVNYHYLTSYKIEEKIAYNMSSPTYFSTNYTDYAKIAFNELKNLTYNTDILNRINRALERIDKSIEYENNGQPYFASQEIKKVFPEV